MPCQEASKDTTSYLPVKYYAGRVNEWYPSRAVPWEAVESGLPGLPGLPELEVFVAAHPRGRLLNFCPGLADVLTGSATRVPEEMERVAEIVATS